MSKHVHASPVFKLINMSSKKGPLRSMPACLQRYSLPSYIHSFSSTTVRLFANEIYLSGYFKHFINTCYANKSYIQNNCYTFAVSAEEGLHCRGCIDFFIISKLHWTPHNGDINIIGFCIK